MRITHLLAAIIALCLYCAMPVVYADTPVQNGAPGINNLDQNNNNPQTPPTPPDNLTATPDGNTNGSSDTSTVNGLNPQGGAATSQGSLGSTTSVTNPTASTLSSNFGTLQVITAEQMLKNITAQLPSVMELVTAMAYVIGFSFVIKGIMLLKHVGEMRTQMSHEHSITQPIVYLIVGALLIYLPSTVVMVQSTFFTPVPYSYVSGQSDWDDVMHSVIVAVQLFGTIAFIKGLVLLSHVGGGHGGQGSLGKGLTHIIGGIFCINIYTFVKVILNTLGVLS